MTRGNDKLTRNLVSMDNPDHRCHRATTREWFSAKNMRGLEADIRSLARESTDGRRAGVDATELCVGHEADADPLSVAHGMIYSLFSPKGAAVSTR